MFSYSHSYFVKLNIGVNLFKIQTRWRHKKDHWSVIAKNKKATDKALQHFDDFYKKVFENKWPSVRLGLVSQNKYCAVVNNYSDSERIEREFESLGAINLKQLIKAHFSHKDAELWRKNVNKVRKMDSEEESQLNKGNNNAIGENDANNDETLNTVSPKTQVDRLILPSGNSSVEGGSALYDFIPATRLKGMEDFIPESEHFNYYNTKNDSSKLNQTEIESEDNLIFPDTLKVYTFETGNISMFPKPKKGSTGVTDYYLLDGSSILPVLCLGLEAGDKVLDMCSAPGGKSLLCLQTLAPSKIVANDLSLSRLNRLRKIYNEFFYNFDKMESNEEIIISNADARKLDYFGEFNKILVDVPCTNDRNSVTENDNNIFRPDRIKERIKLPELQADILTAALKMVENGGTVVYSTCSLSPVQNDGVVQMALDRMWQETNDNIIVKDLTRVLGPYNVIYKFGSSIGLKYGHLVVPYLPSNFGPMYFCKLIKRNSH